MEARRCTATHKLDRISQQQVRDSNGHQGAHSNSQTGRDFMGGMSANQIEARRHSNSLSEWDFMAAGQRLKGVIVGVRKLTT